MHRKSSYLGTIALLVIVTACINPAAAAYKHNETIWTSSGNQFVEEFTSSGLVPGSPYHISERYYFTLKPFTGSNGVYLITPFTSSIIKDGIRPRVKYLYVSLNMPVGVNATWISVSSGEGIHIGGPIKWEGTNAVKDYTYNMGSYYSMNRGINIVLYIENHQPSNREVLSYGGGARQEW